MRTITLLIVHCSATPEGRDHSAADIDRWHRQQGFRNGIGYHYVIGRDGSVQTGRPLDMIGAHCANHNRHSIGICYIGGIATDGKTPKDARTEAQKTALRQLLERLRKDFPKALIVGHRDLNPMKSCPCFDAAREYRDLQP